MPDVTASLKDLVRTIKDLRNKQKVHEDEAQELGREAHRLEQQLTTQMEEMEVHELAVTGVGTAVLKDEIRVRIMDDSAFWEYLRNNGIDNIGKLKLSPDLAQKFKSYCEREGINYNGQIELSVAWNTLTKMVKENALIQVDDAKTWPPGTSIDFWTRVQIK